MAQKTDPSRDPSTKSAAWMEMSPTWAKVETILGGTTSMRKAGEKYLPKHENERTDRYQDRLESNVLYQASRIILDGWTARPFSTPVTREDVPPEVDEVLDDVDAQGNSITVFSRKWFREGLSKAFAHCLVEFPSSGPYPRTLADDRAQRRRPYWCFIKPENLIAASVDVRDGREILTHARIYESDVVRDEFSERVEERIRVYDRTLDGSVMISTWAPQRTKKGEVQWVEVGPQVTIDIDEIPLVTFYADRAELMTGVPPLEEVVDLNIRHWQSNSDQISVLTVARFPILAQSGGSDEGNVEIGPKKLLHIPDTQGRFYYVEHSGAAIEAGRKELMDLEDKMNSYGAEFMRKKPGDRTTATARLLDSSEQTSRLQDAAVRFNDSLANALRLTGKWMKTEATGQIFINAELGPETLESIDLPTLTRAREMRDLSRSQYLAELKRRGTLSDDFDPKEDARRLDAEGDDKVVDKKTTATKEGEE